MISLRAGGVPEHFNYPWIWAIREGLFEKAGINLQWKSYPGGTGQMTAALRDDECDICMVLTEGAIMDMINGNPSRIVSGYVKTPLIWGIHTSPGQEIDLNKLFSYDIAISRKGSGSHLMPIVHSLIEGEHIDPSQFVLVNDLKGAITSINSNESQIFYWEKYTTKPYVEKKIFSRIDEFITPWPCFMIMATEKVIKHEPAALDKVLDLIHEICDSFMNMPDAPEVIANEYDISLKDSRHWFHATEWFTNSWVSDKMLKSVSFTLKEAGIINNVSEKDLVWKR